MAYLHCVWKKESVHDARETHQSNRPRKRTSFFLILRTPLNFNDFYWFESFHDVKETHQSNRPRKRTSFFLILRTLLNFNDFYRFFKTSWNLRVSQSHEKNIYSFSGKLIQRSTSSSSSSRTFLQNTDSTKDDFLEDKGNNSVCNLNWTKRLKLKIWGKWKKQNK